MNAPLLAVAAAAALGALPLAGAEPTVRDLTIDLEILPAEFDFELRSDEVAVDTDDSFDQALGLAIGGRYGFGWAGSPHTVVGGLQATLGKYEYDPSDATFTSYGLRATLGYGYAIGDRWTVLGEVLGEYGLAEFELSASTAGGLSLEGDYTRLGLELRGVFDISDHWLTNAHLGYMIGSATLDGSGRTLDMDQSGILFGIGLSYRFSAAPRRLE